MGFNPYDSVFGRYLWVYPESYSGLGYKDYTGIFPSSCRRVSVAEARTVDSSTALGVWSPSAEHLFICEYILMDGMRGDHTDRVPIEGAVSTQPDLTLVPWIQKGPEPRRQVQGFQCWQRVGRPRWASFSIYITPRRR